MDFFKRLTVLIHVTMMMFVAAFFITFVMQWLDYQAVSRILFLIFHEENIRIAFGCFALFLVLENFIFYKIFSINVRRDKIIAFDNPAGRVSVSLFAMEDLIKRLIAQQPEVKDAKIKITASRKGLSVKIKMVLNSDENIPEITSKVQDLVTQKIHDTIGLEEKIDINIYVGKIILGRLKAKSKAKKEEELPLKDDENPPNIPFQGYRA